MLAAGMFLALPAWAQSVQPDEATANPGRPTVSNPATLAPVGYLQSESGVLGAGSSPEFSTRYEFNQVIKLAVAPRLQFFTSSEPAVHYTADGVTANGTAEVFLGAQAVLMLGEGARPTFAVSYSHRVYDGGAPELDFGSPRNSVILYASADLKGFHYDANAVFNEQIGEGGAHRLQFGQTLPSPIRWPEISGSPGKSGASRNLSCAATPSATFGLSATPPEEISFSMPDSTKA